MRRTSASEQVGADMGEVVADAAVPAGEGATMRAAIQPVTGTRQR
jgi:hypothetical protein